MTRDEVVGAVRGFMAVLSGEGGDQSREQELRKALDRLALAYHFSEAPADERHYPRVREPGIERWKALCQRYSALFPDFGSYNTTMDVIEKVGSGEVIIGDPIDDLADITQDVQEFLDRWDRTSPEDALWHFRSSFEFHWGRHLRSLQVYLHERAFYAPET